MKNSDTFVRDIIHQKELIISQRTRQSYSDEFKAEAVKLVLEQEQSIASVSRNLKISIKTLTNWVTLARSSQMNGRVTLLTSGQKSWLYVAGVKDLSSKEIVGYAVSERMTTDLCLHHTLQNCSDTSKIKNN